MKKNKHISFIACCMAIFAFSFLPCESVAQEMSREDRIKILQALKDGDAAMEASTIGRIDQDVPEEINTMELPPLSVFLDAVAENATVKSAQSQVEQQQNALRLEKRSWMNYIRINGNYSYGRFNTLNQNSDTYVDWYQTTSTGTRSTFNVGASISFSLGDVFNRPLKLKDYHYNIEQLKYAQEQVVEDRRLRIMDAYNSVTAQLATIKAKAENAALYNAQMKISENNFVQGKIDIITLSLERARRSGAVTTYAEARVSLHNAITLLEMLTNIKIVKEK